jgi:hypothetical protein
MFRKGQLWRIEQRTVAVGYEHFKEKYRCWKVIPVNFKTLGDHLLWKRVAADPSQSEVAQKTAGSVRMLRK